MKKAKILTLSVLAGFVITGCELPDKLPLPDLSSPNSNKTCSASMSDHQKATCLTYKKDKLSVDECKFLKEYVDRDNVRVTQDMDRRANLCVDSEGVDIDLDKLMEKNK